MKKIGDIECPICGRKKGIRMISPPQMLAGLYTKVFAEWECKLCGAGFEAEIDMDTGHVDKSVHIVTPNNEMDITGETKRSIFEGR